MEDGVSLGDRVGLFEGAELRDGLSGGVPDGSLEELVLG
jgi:hypothetical protein